MKFLYSNSHKLKLLMLKMDTTFLDLQAPQAKS